MTDLKTKRIQGELISEKFIQHLNRLSDPAIKAQAYVAYFRHVYRQSERKIAKLRYILNAG
jgi:hypothetical protein